MFSSESGQRRRMAVEEIPDRVHCVGGFPMTTVAPEREIGVIAEAPKKLYIDGQWRDAEGGATLEVVDPSTGEVMAEVADASPEDGWAALSAADRAQADFAAMAPRERANILMK